MTAAVVTIATTKGVIMDYGCPLPATTRAIRYEVSEHEEHAY
jgi:hypothetical protein